MLSWNEVLVLAHNAVVDDDRRLTAARDDDQTTSTSVSFTRASNVLRYVSDVVVLYRQLVGGGVRLRLLLVAEHEVDVRHQLRQRVLVRVHSVHSRHRQHHVSARPAQRPLSA